jgi:MFS family permease
LADVYGYGSFPIGVLGSFSFFGSAVLAIALGRVGDRFKKSYALAAALVLVSVSLFIFLLTGIFWVLLVVSLFFGASYLSWPLMSAIIGPQAPASARAFSVAIPLTVGMFAAAFAPYVGGILYQASPYYPFILAIAASMLLALFAFTKVE